MEKFGIFSVSLASSGVPPICCIDHVELMPKATQQAMSEALVSYQGLKKFICNMRSKKPNKPNKHAANIFNAFVPTKFSTETVHQKQHQNGIHFSTHCRSLQSSSFCDFMCIICISYNIYNRLYNTSYTIS